MDPNICWPLAHNVIRGRTDHNTFGLVRTNANGTPRPHQGWDFEAPIGTPCFAIADGEVALVSSTGAYGNLVVIGFSFEGRKLYAAYAHLSSVEVATGEHVTKGQRIGCTGDSGNARGMAGPDLHLHFEIRSEPHPGLGLGGRMTPKTVFGVCPLHEAIDA